MFLKLIILLIFLYFKCVFALPGIQVREINTLHRFPLCVLKLCELYFAAKHPNETSLVIVNNGGRAKADRILKAINEDEMHNMTLLTKDYKTGHIPSTLVLKAKNYLLMMRFPDELPNVIKHLKSLPTWNPLARFVVIITKTVPTQEEGDKFVEQTLIDLFNLENALDVNVMFTTLANPDFLISKSWFPYEKPNCADQVENIHIINTCGFLKKEELNDSSQMSSSNVSMANSRKDVIDYNEEIMIVHYFHTNLFPKFSGHYHHCLLKISASIKEPYAVEHHSIITKGFEVLMLNTIARKLELTPIFVHNKHSNELISTDEFHGFYADLIHKRAHVMIGGLAENMITRQILTPTLPYYVDDLTWCVARAELAPEWHNIFVIFDSSIWILIIAIFLLMALIFYIYAKQNRNRKSRGIFLWSILNSLSLTINNFDYLQSKKSICRIFIALALFYGIHIGVAYRSSLINVLTRPRYKEQISDIASAINGNFTFTGNINIMRYLAKDDEISSGIRSRFEICQDLDECLMELKTNHKLAVGVSREQIRNTFLPLTDLDVFCFSREIVESGLLYKWIKDSGRLVPNDNIIEDSERIVENVRLNNKHFQGAYMLLSVGIGLALIIFVLEHIVYEFDDADDYNPTYYIN